MFGWWVWFFTHWSGSAAFVEKDEADSCHRWPQYNALPGRFKGCYSFRYPNKVQLRFWLIQNFVWKPNSREIDVPPLCEMSFIQPVLAETRARARARYTRYMAHHRHTHTPSSSCQYTQFQGTWGRHSFYFYPFRICPQSTRQATTPSIALITPVWGMSTSHTHLARVPPP